MSLSFRLLDSPFSTSVAFCSYCSFSPEAVFRHPSFGEGDGEALFLADLCSSCFWLESTLLESTPIELGTSAVASFFDLGWLRLEKLCDWTRVSKDSLKLPFSAFLAGSSLGCRILISCLPSPPPPFHCRYRSLFFCVPEGPLWP